MANALREIRDRHLWRIGYNSFADYVEHRFSLHVRIAERFIRSAECLANMVEEGESLLPQTLEQARIMSYLDPANRHLIWKQVVAESTTDPLTKRQVLPHVRRIKEIIKEWRVTQTFYHDALGQKVPKRLEPVWKKKLMMDVAKSARHILSVLDKLPQRYVCFMRDGRLEEMIDEAFRIADECRELVPYCVCPACQGVGPCDVCYRAGWLPEWRYNQWKAAQLAESGQPSTSEEPSTSSEPSSPKDTESPF